MAYSKTTWVNGDTITAAKLNNLEDGVAANDAAIADIVPFHITGVVDVVTYAITLSDITADELFESTKSGLTMIGVIDMNGTELSMVVPLSAQKVGGDYDFAILATNGTIYVSGHLASTDAVVLSPVGS